MNGRIEYDDLYVNTEQIYNISGSNGHSFAPPISLIDFASKPKDCALLLVNYIKLDGTKELLEI